MEDTITTIPIAPTPLVTGPPSGKGREGNGRADSRGLRRPARKPQPHMEPPTEDMLPPTEEDSGGKGTKIDLTV